MLVTRTHVITMMRAGIHIRDIDLPDVNASYVRLTTTYEQETPTRDGRYITEVGHYSPWNVN
jgi:hypothetical protein